MNKKTSRYAVATVVAATLLVAPLAGAADGEVVMVGNVSYVSGGIGEDSRARLDELAPGFNFKADFALNSGAYLSDVQVSVADKTGKQILQATSDGPIFLAKLPPGSYQVVAVVEGKQLQQKVSVSAGKVSQAHFRWPAEH